MCFYYVRKIVYRSILALPFIMKLEVLNKQEMHCTDDWIAEPSIYGSE